MKNFIFGAICGIATFVFGAVFQSLWQDVIWLLQSWLNITGGTVC